MLSKATPDKSTVQLIDWRALLEPTISATGEISYAPLLRVDPDPEPTPTPPAVPPSNGGKEGVEDPAAVLATNKVLRQEQKKYKERITGLEAKLEIFSKIDPEKYALLEQEAQEAERLRVQSSKDKAALEAQYKEQLETVKSNYVSTIDQEKATNLKTIHEMILQQEYVKHGRAEIAHLFRKGHGHRFKLVYDGDRPTLDNAKLIAVDGKGEPIFVKSPDSNEMVEMGMKEFFNEHKDDPDIGLFIPAPAVHGTGTHSLGNYRTSSNTGSPNNAAEAFAGLPTTG